MRVTQKGQVTIPKPIRDKLGIKPGSEVDFVDEGDDGVRVVKSEGLDDKATALARLEAWLSKVEGTGDSGLSAEDVMRQTRDRNAGDHH